MEEVINNLVDEIIKEMGEQQEKRMARNEAILIDQVMEEVMSNLVDETIKEMVEQQEGRMDKE